MTNKVLIIEDSMTQRLQMVEAAKKTGVEVSEHDRWGYAISEMARLDKEDFVLADWEVPDLPEHRDQAIGLLIRAKIPFRILTDYISKVPAGLLKYAIAKADDLGRQVSDLITAEHTEID